MKAKKNILTRKHMITEKKLKIEGAIANRSSEVRQLIQYIYLVHRTHLSTICTRTADRKQNKKQAAQILGQKSWNIRDSNGRIFTKCNGH